MDTVAHITHTGVSGSFVLIVISWGLMHILIFTAAAGQHVGMI